MDKVYVIYKNGEMFKDRGRKTTYLDAKSARQVISCEAKDDIKRKLDYDVWYNLSKVDEKKLIEKEKHNYEIRIFTDSGERV
jgi:CRISPR/Cas system CSM-associated protein Csm4 (group 5 of RAMP superfamily)